MGNFCCNEISEKHNQNMVNDESSGKNLIIRAQTPIDNKGLFTVLEVFGDDTSQSSCMYTQEKKYS